MAENNQAYTNGKTLTQQLHERLRQVIAETEPGGRLLTEPKLAKQLGVSTKTIARDHAVLRAVTGG